MARFVFPREGLWWKRPAPLKTWLQPGPRPSRDAFNHRRGGGGGGGGIMNQELTVQNKKIENLLE